MKFRFNNTPKIIPESWIIFSFMFFISNIALFIIIINKWRFAISQSPNKSGAICHCDEITQKVQAVRGTAVNEYRLDCVSAWV